MDFVARKKAVRIIYQVNQNVWHAFLLRIFTSITRLKNVHAKMVITLLKRLVWNNVYQNAVMAF
jgi:hypothetical protein